MASRICLQLSLDSPRPGVTIEQLEEALEERQRDRRQVQGTGYPWPVELERRRQDRRRQKARPSSCGIHGTKVAAAG